MHAKRRMGAPGFQLRRKRARISSYISVSSCVAARDGVRAGDGGEIGVAQLELHGAGFAASCSRRRRPTISQRRASVDSSTATSAVSSEKVCSWLMDLGPSSSPISRVEPAAGVEAARFAGEREAPLAEALLEEVVIERGEVADFADAERVQVLLGDLADARNLADVERREESGFAPGNDPEDAVGLGLVGGDLGDQPRGGDADGAVETGRGLHGARAGGGRRAERRPVAAARCR